jgi:ubiquinone/menaquinone biosynthesis C-methylase UbiE
MTSDRADPSDANRRFWNELCGTSLACSLGITDHTTDSLRRFDEAYMGLYPYLLRHVPVGSFTGLRVLEVGLGYGTLGQKIAQSCGSYTGLDIAPGPVEMMRCRFSLQGIAGEAIQGNMLNAPFPDEYFDRVVSIGCFHHTGDTQRCLDETYRLLRPGGVAHLMIYNRFSARQWTRWPLKTVGAWVAERTFRSGTASSPEQRAAYDSDSDGTAAPETEFFSLSQLRRMLRRFRRVRLTKENFDNVTFRGRRLIPRLSVLSTMGRVLGLDIYIEAEK